MTRPAHAASSARTTIASIRDWHIWSLRLPALVWLLGIDLVAVVGVVLAVAADSTITPHGWLLFTLFVVCSTVHLVLTRPAEERRRAAHLRGKVEHIDQTSVWLFSAALLLPMALVAVLLIVLRGQRYLIARKRPSTFIATSAFIALGALVTGLVARATPLRDWLATGSTANIPVPALTLSLAMLAAIAAYFGVQAVLIAVSRVLIARSWSLQNVLGSRADNLLELHNLLIGVFAALVGAFALPALVAVTAVTSYSTFTEQRLSQLQHERERLEVDALHDPLTGLPNRRGFEPQADVAMVTGQAAGRPSAVLMADLDHFKDWNTRLGHFGADQVLTSVAQVLRGNTRRSDLLCRWGGEELAIVMPDTTRAEAAVLAERLRAAVQALRIEVTKPAGGQPMPVTGITVSIGVAMIPDVGTELMAAQEAADQALQAAKDGGRNRVEFAGRATDPATTQVPA